MITPSEWCTLVVWIARSKALLNYVYQLNKCGIYVQYQMHDMVYGDVKLIPK